MIKKRNAIVVIVSLVMLILSACGSEGPGGGAGGGKTVVISGETQNGESTAVFTSVGGPPFTITEADVLKYTITSTPYSGATAILPSPVTINRQKIAFIPLPDSNGAPSPRLPSFQETATGTIDPGGSLNLEIGIVEPIVKQYLYDNYLPELQTGVTYKYSVAIDFIGEEINTGTSVSCRVYSSAFITQ